jgi:hypothetical protein
VKGASREQNSKVCSAAHSVMFGFVIGHRDTNCVVRFWWREPQSNHKPEGAEVNTHAQYLERVGVTSALPRLVVTLRCSLEA